MPASALSATPPMPATAMAALCLSGDAPVPLHSPLRTPLVVCRLVETMASAVMAALPLAAIAVACAVAPGRARAADAVAAAAAHIADATRRLGPGAGPRAVDRIVTATATATANRYGNGHPWLACADLRQVAHDFAAGHRPDMMLAITAAVLDGDGPPAGEDLATAGR